MANHPLYFSVRLIVPFLWFFLISSSSDIASEFRFSISDIASGSNFSASDITSGSTFFYFFISSEIASGLISALLHFFISSEMASGLISAFRYFSRVFRDPWASVCSFIIRPWHCVSRSLELISSDIASVFCFLLVDIASLIPDIASVFCFLFADIASLSFPFIGNRHRLMGVRTIHRAFSLLRLWHCVCRKFS